MIVILTVVLGGMLKDGRMDGEAKYMMEQVFLQVGTASPLATVKEEEEGEA